MTQQTYTTYRDKKRFYKRGAWLRLRQQALERDNYECRECKRQGKVTADSIRVEGERKRVVLNVHHKKEIEDYPQYALELWNLETLCIRHHNEIHDKQTKMNPNEKFQNEEKW